VSFKIVMTTSVTRSLFTKQYQTSKTKTKTKTDSVWSQIGLVLRPTVSDHIAVNNANSHTSPTVTISTFITLQGSVHTYVKYELDRFFPRHC